jgi:hypothetical protein
MQFLLAGHSAKDRRLTGKGPEPPRALSYHAASDGYFRLELALLLFDAFPFPLTQPPSFSASRLRFFNDTTFGDPFLSAA